MGSEKRVLIIDDSQTITKLLEFKLEREGFTVDSVSDGQAALDTLRTTAYDVVVLDLMLPILDGFQVLQTLRTENLSVPILVLSGRSRDADIQKALKLGAADYIRKPFSPAELLARLNRLLEG